MKARLGFKSYGVKLGILWLQERSIIVMDNVLFGNVSRFCFDLETYTKIYLSGRLPIRIPKSRSLYEQRWELPDI